MVPGTDLLVIVVFTEKQPRSHSSSAKDFKSINGTSVNPCMFKAPTACSEICFFCQ